MKRLNDVVVRLMRFRSVRNVVSHVVRFGRGAGRLRRERQGQAKQSQQNQAPFAHGASP